jgi:serine phosphatase RsbU (regulator of sigma subunit)
VTGIGPWQRLASLAIEAVSLLALPGYGQLDVTDHTRGLEPGELAFCELLRLGRLSAPERLPDAAAAAAKHFGGRDVEMLLVDHGQVVLVPFGFAEPPVRIEGSVAGRAFRQVDVQEISVPGGRRLWLPLLDGVDRLGVLGVTFSELDELTRLRADRFAALLAEILLSKSTYGDSLAQTARLRPMTLAAEMQWSLMPPLTVGSERVVVSGFVQPSYEVGGDIFDYALGEGVAHVAIFDAMGHGLEAALLASVAVGAYRNARRRPLPLPRTVSVIEDALAAQFGRGRFVTAIVTELELESGRLRWVNAGHPPPLLLRKGRVVKELSRPPNSPLGVGLNDALTVHEEALEPGDRLVLYSDGIIEAMDAASGERFGVDRLVEFIARAEAAGEPVPETMRRLGHAVVKHQGDELQDDATQVLLEWKGGEMQQLLE